MPGGILSFLIFFPIIAGIFIGIASSNNFIRQRIKFFALLFTFIEMILSILIYFSFDKQNGGFQFIDYFDADKIGKIIIDKPYPFALIKYLNENFNKDFIFKSKNATFKIFVPEWLKI